MLRPSFNFYFFQKDVLFKHRILSFVLTLAGSGLSPKAPGTAGSLFAMALWYVAGLNKATLATQIFAALFVLVFGYLACAIFERESSEKNKDNQRIVIDEAAGMWIAMIALPQTWWAALLAFGFFRFFDIIKLYPCNYFDEKMKNAAGIMLDDVVAGLYANTVIYIIVSAIKWL